jgi:lysyl endopeptidase
MGCRQLTTMVRCLLALAVFASCAVHAQVARVSVTSVPPAEYRPNTVAKSASPALMLDSGASARRVELAAPAAWETAALKEQNAAPTGSARRAGAKALAVGFGRVLPGAAATIPLSTLTWLATSDGGRAARIEVRSPDAKAMRVAMQLPATDPDLSVRFVGSSADAVVFGPIPANTIAEDTERFGLYWSPVLPGDVATIEFHAGPGAELDGLVLTLPRVSHQVVGNAELSALSAKTLADIGRAKICNIDVACVTPQTTALANASKSVAEMLFTSDQGVGLLCTGTLLNDSVKSSTPYLFSAAHCMTSASVAHTLNTFWFFDAKSCGSRTPSPYVQTIGGAALLGRSQDNDWALVRLNQAPPAGVIFSAWRVDPVPIGTVTMTLHQPEGDLKKWSQGSVSAYTFYADTLVHGTFNEVHYTQGITEAGSSGSALMTYLASGDYYEVRGGLSEGDPFACTTPSSLPDPKLLDYYTRLEDMLPLVRQYLTPDATIPAGQVVAVEFYNGTLNHYFISTNASEINDLDTGVHVGWERTGLRFLAYNNQAAGTSPVCRFYRAPAYGDSHFYSASPAECANTAAKHPVDWVYESPVVFYMQLPDQTSGACPAGTRPLWRFFNQVTTNHRYTAEVVIRDQMRASPAIWIAEGYGPDAVTMCAANQ